MDARLEIIHKMTFHIFCISSEIVHQFYDSLIDLLWLENNLGPNTVDLERKLSSY